MAEKDAIVVKKLPITLSSVNWQAGNDCVAAN